MQTSFASPFSRVQPVARRPFFKRTSPQYVPAFQQQLSISPIPLRFEGVTRFTIRAAALAAAFMAGGIVVPSNPTLSNLADTIKSAIDSDCGTEVNFDSCADFVVNIVNGKSQELALHKLEDAKIPMTVKMLLYMKLLEVKNDQSYAEIVESAMAYNETLTEMNALKAPYTTVIQLSQDARNHETDPIAQQQYSAARQALVEQLRQQTPEASHIVDKLNLVFGTG